MGRPSSYTCYYLLSSDPHQKIAAFSLFAARVLKPPLKRDFHINPSTMMCQPCTMEFSYILKVEQLGTELEEMLSEVIGMSGIYF